MTRDNERAYMELVRQTWLTCRGPQRQFAQRWIREYDLARAQARHDCIKYALMGLAWRITLVLALVSVSC